jgi:phosphomannomutase
VDETDGLSMEFEDWRFNLRMSNTEPLLRLNIESRGDKKVVQEHLNMIESLVGACS